MPRPAAVPPLSPGRVYRTRDLARWDANPTRLAKRLVSGGVLQRLSQGVYARPRSGRFGPVPPTDKALLRSFLGTSKFVVTGPERWNALGLGSTAMFAATLVYNTKRTGAFDLAGKPFYLRRVAFPSNPPAEWFVVDLLEHAGEAGVAREDVAASAVRAVASGRLDAGRLKAMVAGYATQAVRSLLCPALQPSTA